MKCEFCGKDESLPFVCNYCASVFCADHRLPESHMCKGDLSKKRVIMAPPATSFSWSGSSTSYSAPKAKGARPFSTIEVRDIAIAWFGLGLAFFLATQRGNLGNLPQAIISNPVEAGIFLAISLVTVGSGFVLHELSHKFSAQRYGYWAEFRMWPMGLVFALVTSLIGLIFAAPGATYISGANITREENGKISLAGPLTNVGVALAFLPFLLFGPPFTLWSFLGNEGVSINVFLAAFNLLPIMPLDGAKVFGWNKLIWAVAFVPLALIVAVLFFGL